MSVCGSCCSAGEEENTSAGASTFWLRLGLSLVLAGQGMVFGLAINIASPAYGSPTYWWLHGALLLSALTVMGLLGPRLVRESREALAARRITVEALFVASALGAFAGSLIATFTGVGAVYYEVVAIVLAVYTIGKKIGDVSRDRVLAEISRYREEYEYAQAIGPDGKAEETRVEALATGARVRVRPGGAVTVDGVILAGSGSLRESHLTGEPVPVVRHPGAEVHAGSWSIDGTFEIEVIRSYGERRIDTLLHWVEDARRHPSGLQEEADRTIGWFFPLVMLIAFLTFGGWLIAGAGWAVALFNAMAVLLVACPCALGLATPIAIWKGLFRLASAGLLCRHGKALDALGRSQRVFFDKTGTLSEARLIVKDFRLVDPAEAEKLGRWVAALEAGLDHPVARALACLADPEGVEVIDCKIIAGKGVRGTVRDGGGEHTLEIGSLDLLPEERRARAEDFAASSFPDSNTGVRVWIVLDGSVAGVARIEELLRPSAEESLEQLRDRGLSVEILSGDPDPSWESIAGVRIDKGLSPEEKRERVRLSSLRGEWPVFVGDGINDTPAMVSGGVSIAVNDGASLVRAAADAILVQSNLSKIAAGVDLSRNIRIGARGNIRFALGYNSIGIALAAAGILHPVVAALLMVASSALVSIRALNSAEVPD